MNKRLTFASLLLFTAVAGFSYVAAQTNPPPPEGITLSPALQKISVPAQQAEYPLEFRVTNNRPSSQTIKLSVADFNSLNETGGLFFLGSNPTQLQKKYGLNEWVRLSVSEITVPSKQTVSIKATILNQPGMPAGGHYGALMLTLSSGNQGRPSPNEVAVRPIASSLLFVSKQGGEIYKLKLTKVEDNHSLFRLPSEVMLRFKNEGNTHLVPRGIVTVTSGDKVIRKGIINEDSAIILPENARRFTVKLNVVSQAYTAGKYTMKVDYRFDGFDGIRTYQSSFFVATPLGLLTILGLLVAFLGIVLFLHRKKFISFKLPRVKRK